MKEVLFDISGLLSLCWQLQTGVYANRADAEAQPLDYGRKSLKSKRKGKRDEKTIEDWSDGKH